MSKKHTDPNSEAIETLKRIVDDVDVVMLSSIERDGKIVSRPMQKQELEYDGDLWFITKKDTRKYEEVQANPHVNISVVGKSYASISGKAYFVDDPERLKKHWNKIYEEIFDADYDDPNLCMVKIEMESAEYWDTGNRTGMVLNFFKNLTNDEDHGNSEDDINKTIDLS